MQAAQKDSDAKRVFRQGLKAWRKAFYTLYAPCVFVFVLYKFVRWSEGLSATKHMNLSGARSLGFLVDNVDHLSQPSKILTIKMDEQPVQVPRIRLVRFIRQRLSLANLAIAQNVVEFAI